MMSKIVNLNDVLNEIEEKERITTSKNKKRGQFTPDKTTYSKNNNYYDKKVKEKTPSKLCFKKRSNYGRCKNSAIYSLAMREHSRLEISNKLKKKEYVEGVDLDKLLDELEESNYLNEERFVESFIRYRSGRGQGIIKISNELKQRGIKQSQITNALQEADINWHQIASEQRIKKFGEVLPQEFKEKARQMRFLSGRGFDGEVIRSVVG